MAETPPPASAHSSTGPSIASLGDEQTNSSSAAKTGRRSSRKASGEDGRVLKRNRLQEEHQRMLRVEANLVKRVLDHRGPAGFAYKCLKCGSVKRARLRAIGHAANCGKKKTGKKRGKGKKKLSCHLCEETTSTVREMAIHRREAHSEVLMAARLQCTKCLKPFSHRKNYREHLKLHNQGSKMFKCKDCHESFRQLRNLTRHELSHLEGQQKFSCGTCGIKYSRLDNLKRHEKCHDHEGPVIKYKCPSCPQEFSYESTLKRHQKKKHLENDVGQFGGDGDISSEMVELLQKEGYCGEEITLLMEKYSRLPMARISSSSASPPVSSASPPVTSASTLALGDTNSG